ncbi:xanthine dehydrogenase family protein molybdopterin-binding subunit [Rhodospira trueperi]|uniref:Isoquinoline 1-oxidoreductase, beta subunit n=1 Tax=Rhodospira trueperi TaxID=69960 RepID=A0A1G6XF68_9PROT|nr:xanthine dehydrogenase family protein molybdopterin-binding subunit [Rhodospira trueperi]SDD75965.1 isoquinoline 1-oxidoreductase, beta subunit [Rhodospira trueperi]
MTRVFERPTSSPLHPSRRTVLKVMAGAGAGLTLGITLPQARAQDASPSADDSDTFAPNAFVRVLPDNTVTVLIKHLEMGQGVFTGLTTLVAEEMDTAWEQMRPEHSPADAKLYNNLHWGPVQGTGGSSSLANAFEQMRRAGAVARILLVQAAADAWGVPAGEIETRDGLLRHAASGREATFGAMAERAAVLKAPDPASVTLKSSEDFRLIGRDHLSRPDSAKKVRGQTTYAADVRLPGMLSALVRRPSRFGAVPGRIDGEAALAMSGVRAVLPLPHGVAVVAESHWQAVKAREAIKIEWDESGAVKTGSKALLEQYRDLGGTSGTTFRSDGDALAALAEPESQVIEAVYDVPFAAHAPMEPLSAGAMMTDTGIEVWAGAQSPTFDVLNIAAAARLKPDQVRLRIIQAGGSFGRRASPNSDSLVEVAAIARGLADQGIEAPVTLTWTREDDIRGGYYRPMAVHAVAGALTQDGQPSAWRHRVVTQSLLKNTPFAATLIEDGIDRTSVEGVIDLPYAIANVKGELHSPEPGIPGLWWRSVGHSHTAFAVESFIDEMAHAAGADPLVMRRDLLQDHPRLLNVLNVAAKEAGWGLPQQEGQGQGLAVHTSFNTHVAHVAEVTVKDGAIRVDRLICAVDCGLPVNPDVIRAQIAGGSIFGLSAALRGRVTLDDTGLVSQSNFHDYEIIRMGGAPEIEVHIVPSTEPPTGVGEPGVPTVAPAVANAVFAATGKRLRSLPLRLG